MQPPRLLPPRPAPPHPPPPPPPPPRHTIPPTPPAGFKLKQEDKTAADPAVWVLANSVIELCPVGQVGGQGALPVILLRRAVRVGRASEFACRARRAKWGNVQCNVHATQPAATHPPTHPPSLLPDLLLEHRRHHAHPCQPAHLHRLLRAGRNPEPGGDAKVCKHLRATRR